MGADAMVPDPALVAQLFVLINPFSSLTVLLAAHGQGLPVRRLAAGAVMTAFLVAVSLALVGPFLLRVFGISLDSFRIAGGIVLLLLGVETVRRREDRQVPVSNIDGLMSILATPTMTGPATITYVTLKTHEIGLGPLLVNLTVAFSAVALVVGVFVLLIPRIHTRVVNIISRVLGLFLTAVAIEMMAKGLTGILAPMRAT
jgi:multiple antibiotic resistance protein